MELFLNIFSFASSAFLIKKWHNDLQSYQNIKSAKIFTPSFFLSDLSAIKDQLIQSPNNKDEMFFKGFIEGIVESNQGVPSTMKNAAKLVYKVAYRSKIFENDRFLNKIALIKEIPREKTVSADEFFLKDFDARNFCWVQKDARVVANQALQIVKADARFDTKISIFKRILSFFNVFFHIISLFAEDKLSYRGIQVGTCDVELGIELKSFVIVYGKIVFNLVTNILRIEKPEYIVKDKSYILNELAKKIKRTQFVLAILFFINIFTGIKLLKKLYKFIKGWRRWKNSKEEVNLKGLDKFSNNDHMKCVICYQNVRNIIFNPCKHLAICTFCLGNIKRSKKCPICNEMFDSYVPLFSR